MSQVRWAVLNDAALLRRHGTAWGALAEAMSRGESVGRCVGLVEELLARG